MTATLFAAGMAVLGVGALLDLAFGIRSRGVRRAPYLCATAASVLLLVAGVRLVVGGSPPIWRGSLFSAGGSSLIGDSLSGLFLTLTSGVAIGVSLAFAAWVAPDRRVRARGLGAIYNVLLAAVAVILVAGNAFLFLFAWEVLTLCFYALAAFERHRPDRANAGYVTLVVSKVGGAFLLVGFLLLAGAAGSLAFGSWTAVPPGGLKIAAYVLIVLGFAVKVGMVPFQLWMPVGYPAAPGPARAAMAGVAVNVGVYGLWRFLGILGPPPKWLAVAVLVLGSLTALLGIAHAAIQSRLGRAIAYSSVENGGIIITGFGIALTGAVVHSARLVAVGLLAATLQAVAHAIAKAVLFAASTNLGSELGTDDLDDLRGVGRRLPWSGAAFAVGSITLAGLPPTIGFVSEWFMLEALIQQFRLPGLALKLAMAAAGALIALTIGFAVLTFVRLIGLVILGGEVAGKPARRERLLTRLGVVWLAVPCLALAAATPLEVRYIAKGLAPVVPHAITLGALKSPLVLQPVYADFSILSPTWLWIALPTLIAGSVLLGLALSRGRLFRVRRVPPWLSATGEIAGEDSYTTFGYANPVRHVLASVLRSRRETRRVENHPEGAAHVYTSDVVEPVESYIVGPLARSGGALVRTVKRLQSGRLAAYVAYMLIALLAAVVLVSTLR